jgi:hypothetical protein
MQLEFYTAALRRSELLPLINARLTELGLPLRVETLAILGLADPNTGSNWDVPTSRAPTSMKVRMHGT